MPCLPESGGCERPFTDVLVAHLNRIEGAHYIHRACLDVAERLIPQPEALYVDAENGHQLVIERKSISWPVDYPYRHNNDHTVGEFFANELRDLTADDLYEIRLPMLMQGKRSELLRYALQATKQIRAKWATVASGSGLKGRGGEGWWWVFRKLPEWEREDNAPNRGLQISLIGPGLSFDDFLDPSSLPDALGAALTKIYASCTSKFVSHTEARRILLLDPHGDLRTEGGEWWQRVWASIPPPSPIQEIWSGILDWVTEDTQDWMFELLYSTSTERHKPALAR
ncbi:MAG TPA: hypothetical protein VHB45_15590 [Alloacidobacterium sp.]|nr:hypothetical protein [Alloacidobacterium sp.]